MDDRQMSENEYLDEVYSDMENEHVVTVTISCPGSDYANVLLEAVAEFMSDWTEAQWTATIQPIDKFMQDEGCNDGETA
jgi:hypothetical protein